MDAKPRNGVTARFESLEAKSGLFALFRMAVWY